MYGKIRTGSFKSRAWQNPKRGKRSGSSDRIWQSGWCGCLSDHGRYRHCPDAGFFSADAGRSVFVWADCSGKCFKWHLCDGRNGKDSIEYPLFSGKNGFKYSRKDHAGRGRKSDRGRRNAGRRSFHCRCRCQIRTVCDGYCKSKTDLCKWQRQNVGCTDPYQETRSRAGVQCKPCRPGTERSYGRGSRFDDHAQ